jgi:hypothetical protein
MLKAADRIAGSAAFAYATLALIQAKVVWGMWDHKDLLLGDEYGYFIDASRWADGFELNPILSPLYQVYYGSLKWLFPGAYEVTIVHRLLVVFAATLLVLAVLRRLLSPGIAWLLAVWWAVLPINYDTLYTVHLFAFLPILAAVLLALTRSGLWVRATVFGILLAEGIVVRPEAIIAALIWAVVWIGYEIRELRAGQGELRPLLAAVAAPVAAVALLGGLTLLAYPGPPDRISLSDAWTERQESSVCGSFALGYAQREDDFEGSPFYDCEQVILRFFDEPRPQLAEAIRDNPGAMADHVLWNVHLLPFGVQEALFDRTSGGVEDNPDFVPVVTGSKLALAGSLALVALFAAGGVLLWPRRRELLEEIREQGWGWLVLGVTAVNAVIVVLMQRPRPAYMFALTLLLLALAGLCLAAFVRRWPGLGRLRALLPAAALALVIFLPAHYDSGYATNQTDPGRPLKTMVDRLEPWSEELRGRDKALLATRAAEACAWIGEDDPCSGRRVSLGTLPRDDASLRQRLDQTGIDYIYADEADLADPSLAAALRGLERSGWVVVAPGDAAEDWLFLERAQPPAGAAAPK